MKEERKSYYVPFLAGQEYPRPRLSNRVYRPLGMDAWELQLIVSGGGDLVVNDSTYRITVGDVLLFPPGSPHDYGQAPTTGWTKYWVYFFPKSHWEAYLSWPATFGKVMHLNLLETGYVDAVEECFREMIRMSRKNVPHRLEWAMNALERILLTCDLVNPRTSQYTIDSRIRNVVQLIEDHYTRTITHKELAEEACLSPSRFAVVFRRELNTTPLAYLEKYRLDRSVEMLLHSALPINEIAEMTGFHCQFYFSRVFRKRFDQSPSGFRKSGRQLTGDRILHEPLVKV